MWEHLTAIVTAGGPSYSYELPTRNLFEVEMENLWWKSLGKGDIYDIS